MKRRPSLLSLLGSISCVLYLMHCTAYAQEQSITDEHYKDTQMWLKLLGHSFALDELQELKSLDLSSTQLHTDDLTYLKPLGALTTLKLSNTQFSDSGVGYLSGMPALVEVDLSGTNLTDESVPKIVELRRLRKLNVADTKITYDAFLRLKKELPDCLVEGYHEQTEAEAFTHRQLSQDELNSYRDVQVWLDQFELYYTLERIARLEKLNLRDEVLTDDSLKFLSRLKGLKELSLSNTQISDEGVGYLKALEGLEVLYLSNTQVTDEGLEHLRGLKHLRVLYLNGTRVTNCGLYVLAAFPALVKLSLANLPEITNGGLVSFRKAFHLKLLDVRATQVNKDAVKVLNEYLPDLSVFHNAV